MPSEKSGGEREYEKIRLERNAKRPEGYNERAIAAYKRIKVRDKSPEGALTEAFAYLRQVMREAAADPGLPPEQRRDQVTRAAAALTKVADPKKQLDERGAVIREQAADIAELQAAVRNAPQEHPGVDPGAPGLTEH